MSKRKPLFTSKIIIGVSPTPETAAAMRAIAGAHPDTQVNPCVFEVTIGAKKRYCAWSGGELRANAAGTPEPFLTTIGQGAVEALCSLPFLPHGKLIFQELKRGPTALHTKVAEAFYKTVGSQCPIVFVGDLAGELDGHMGLAFALNGAVQLDQILGRQRQVA